MKKTMVFLFPILSLLIAGLGFAQQPGQKTGFGTPFGTTAMELFIPAFIMFLLAFIGLSVGIIFGRKGISGSCSSIEGQILDIQCLCGQSRDCSANACDKSVLVSAICTDIDAQRCREIQTEFEKKEQKISTTIVWRNDRSGSRIQPKR